MPRPASKDQKPLRSNEEERLKVLRQYAVLDTPPEEAFDRITDLASQFFNVPIVLVSLVDKERQWFKACYGLDVRQTDRSLAFCAYTILDSDVMIVLDATADERFQDNALVTGYPHIRFYAGAPLITPSGHAMGSLCLIDTKTHETFTSADQEALKKFAAMVVDELELRLGSSALARAEERIRAMIDSAVDVIYTLSPVGTFLSLNPAFTRLTGYAAKAWIGRGFLELVHPDDHALALQLLQDAVAGETEQRFELKLVTRTGTDVVINVTATPVLQEGQVAFFSGIARDVTHERQLAKALADSEGRLRAIIDNTSDPVFIRDNEGRYILTNPACDQAIAVDRFALRGKTNQDVFSAEDTERISEIDAQVMASGQAVQYEINLLINGQEKAFLTSKAPYRSPDGVMLGVIGVSHDITQRKQAELALQQSERKFRNLVEHTNDLVWEIDTEGRFTYVSPRIRELVGYAPHELLGRTTEAFMTPEEQNRFTPLLLRYAQTRQAFPPLEKTLIHKDGRSIILETSGSPVLDEDGTLLGYQGIARDITQRKQVEETLRVQERALAAASSGLVIADATQPNMPLIYVNPAFERITGFARSEALGRNCQFLQGEKTDPSAVDAVRTALRQGTEGTVTLLNYRKDGTPFWNELRIAPVHDPHGALTHFVGVQTDVTARVQAEQMLTKARDTLEERVRQRTADLARANEQLLHDAYHDTLTNLPNRAFFLGRLNTALEHHRRRPRFNFAVLFLDFDRFKLINDSLGHGAGDQFLIAVSRRLGSCLRPEDTFARLSGDEFAILLEDIEDVENAVQVAQRIHAVLQMPIEIQGHTLYASFSTGIALPDGKHATAEELLRDADIAMYYAKAQGKARHVVFDQSMRKRIEMLIMLENQLRHAIERQQLQVYYQPIMHTSSGALSGFEALVRWVHPTHGFISPAEFIPIAENTGLVVEIDRWVLAEACRQIKTWQAIQPELTLSVNLSAQQFTRPDLLPYVRTVLQQTNLEPQDLRLEITEETFMNKEASVARTMNDLKALGLQLSIDDFGTGYSSLSYLQRFPADILKIDRVFIDQVTRSEESLTLVRTILAMAKSLHMKVVAEGVETAEQHEVLKALQCDYLQGYLFSKPLPNQGAALLLARSDLEAVGK